MYFIKKKNILYLNQIIFDFLTIITSLKYTILKYTILKYTILLIRTLDIYYRYI